MSVREIITLPDPRLKRLLPDPERAAQNWHARNGAIQINHMVAVRDTLTRSNPDAVREVYRLLAEAKRRGPAPGTPDMNPSRIQTASGMLNRQCARATAQGVSKRFIAE